MERLLAPSDASHILGVVPATVRAMAIDGRLRPVAITEGGIRLFRREDVERLAAERTARAHGISGSKSGTTGTEPETAVLA